MRGALLIGELRLVAEQLQSLNRRSIGRVWGALTTMESFENYRLRLEFKWGEKKWPPRESAKRDSGVLYHAVGPHGATYGAWMRSFESQVQEGDINGRTIPACWRRPMPTGASPSPSCAVARSIGWASARRDTSRNCSVQ